MHHHPKDICIDDYSYELPSEKIALYPLSKRDESKLLVFKNGNINETQFKNLSSHLPANSLLVFNNTRVINARLLFQNKLLHTIELFCLECETEFSSQNTAVWNCLVGNLKRWKEEVLTLKNDRVLLKAKQVQKLSTYVKVHFEWEPAHFVFSEVLEHLGHIPLPPYLNRKAEALDAQRYQTVYAQSNGSVAAPTAGLHFTEEVFQKLERNKIKRCELTLHVGAGTFKPVKSATMQAHTMHPEWMEFSKEMLMALLQQLPNPVISVGTTSLRTLESLYWMGLKALKHPEASLSELEISQWEAYTLDSTGILPETSIQALIHWMEKSGCDRLICKTHILIAPPYELKLSNGIITNFHQPKSTLLLLIASIVGNNWRSIYDYALKQGYRFLSYGDSSLLLK